MIIFWCLYNYVANMNRALKGIKSDNFVDFICSDHWDFIVTSNKVVLLSNLLVVEKYIKNWNSINVKDIQSAQLSQSKSYLKILSISYLIKGTNTSINMNIIKTVIKSTYIFNNIHIVSKLRIVKVSPKSDIAIVWINIWNLQNSLLAKTLINRCFNIRSYIAII